MFRLIARLDVKGANLIKPVRMEGLRVIGDPNEYARRYAEQGACELLYLDAVASLYGRNNLVEIVERTTRDVFIPVAVGGGIRSVAQARALFNAGADMVCINTGALGRPALINEISARYGSQAITVSIEAKRVNGGWEAYTDAGREPTGRNALKWAKEAVGRGAGQLLLTAVDRDGTRAGFDLALIRAISGLDLPVPVIASGGCGSAQHVCEAQQAGADAVAIASVLHYNMLTIKEINDELTQGKFQAGSRSRGRSAESRPAG